jgi:hypothetical protein
MIARAHRGLRRSLAETTYLIDATGLRLDARSLDWARFSEGVCGAKLHVIYDPDADRPIYAAITPARVNDITAAQAMPIEHERANCNHDGKYRRAISEEALCSVYHI